MQQLELLYLHSTKDVSCVYNCLLRVGFWIQCKIFMQQLSIVDSGNTDFKTTIK